PEVGKRGPQSQPNWYCAFRTKARGLSGVSKGTRSACRSPSLMGDLNFNSKMFSPSFKSNLTGTDHCLNILLAFKMDSPFKNTSANVSKPSKTKSIWSFSNSSADIVKVVLYSQSSSSTQRTFRSTFSFHCT